jgi:hypothetical protein
MTTARWTLLGLAGFLAIALAPTTVRAQEKDLEAKLPAAAKRTFRDKFPKAVIEKLEAEEENGVMVYDIEFKDGDTEKETDITADGTMLEFTVVIEADDLPQAVKAPIEKAAEGATMKRVERIEISYETKNGKTIKLAEKVTHYAVEMTKGVRSAEIVVAADGKVVEEPKWSGDKEKRKAQGKDED